MHQDQPTVCFKVGLPFLFLLARLKNDTIFTCSEGVLYTFSQFNIRMQKDPILYFHILREQTLLPPENKTHANLMIKLVDTDALVISCHEIAILRHEITILCHNITFSSGCNNFSILMKKKNLPVRSQKSSGKKLQTCSLSQLFQLIQFTKQNGSFSREFCRKFLFYLSGGSPFNTT